MEQKDKNRFFQPMPAFQILFITICLKKQGQEKLPMVSE